MTISRKILSVGLLAFIAFGLVATFMVMRYRSALYAEKRTQIERLTQSTVTLVEQYVARSVSGELDDARARAQALAAVEKLRYGGDGYFWINDMDARMIMHPVRTDWANTDLSDFEDPNGKRIFVEFSRVASESGAGFVDYEFPRPGATEPQPKFSYVAAVPQWGWVIGTGIYVDDVEVQANRLMYVIAGIGLLISGIMAFIFVALSRNISRGVGQVADAASRMAEGDVNQVVEHHATDETGTLADAARAQIEYVRSMATAVDALSRGDLSVTVTPRSDADMLGRSFVGAKAALEQVIAEIRGLTAAAASGRLSVRGDAGHHQGAYGEVVAGINGLLDAVVQPIHDASKVLKSLADKDLTRRMKDTYAGEFATMKVAFDSALESLGGALQDVSAASEQVADASGVIARESQALAEHSSEQAASLEEISSSLHELASMTQQNRGSAVETLEAAQETRSAAAEGVREVESLAVTMEKLQEASRATARIIKTIDEIAFQTNLLALNAAVEAARAGDAGRGFTVVADEVRSLSQRSAEAARNTATLIEQAISSAESGAAGTTAVLDKLRAINTLAERVTTTVDRIAAATQEQADGVEQISTAVNQMNVVTQSTAASAEESASAASQLASQADGLRSLVGHFQIGESSGQNGRVDAALKGSPVWPEPTHSSRDGFALAH